MKKTFISTLAIIVCLSLFAGCGNSTPENQSKPVGEPSSAVVSSESSSTSSSVQEESSSEKLVDEKNLAYEYYARELKAFLALNNPNYSVILKDVDCDGMDELVTYWEDEIPDESSGNLQRIYKMDLFDLHDSKELHFTKEKLDSYPHYWEETFFISGSGNLVYHVYYPDISPGLGWVYDNSVMLSIKGGLYQAEYDDPAIFRAC